MINWTPDMIAMLGTVPDRVVAERFGMSGHTAYMKRIALGISPARKWARGRVIKVGKRTLKQMQLDAFWTPERDGMLGADTDENVAKLLKIRIGQVRDRRVGLGIKAYGHAMISAEAMKRLESIKHLLGVRPDREVGKMLGLSHERIRQFRKKLGIEKADLVSSRFQAKVGGKNRKGVEIVAITPKAVVMKCECGREFSCTRSLYTNATTCGKCTKYERDGYLNTKHNRLTIREFYRDPQVDQTMARCDCSCGKTWCGIARNVIMGLTKSCGCLLEEYWNRLREQGVPNNNSGHRPGRKPKKTVDGGLPLTSRPPDEYV